MGASWVRSHILRAHPNAKLAVFAIWVPTMPGDSRAAWNPSIFNDPRVTQFWDGDLIAGHWLADHRTGDLAQPGGVAWDAFLAFPSSSRWTAVPTGLLASGTPIIGATDSLQRDFAPRLG